MTQAKQQETTPALRQATPPAIPQEDIGLSGQYDQSDQVIPVWFLVQPTSQDFPDAKPGQFATRDGRVADTLIVVPLRIAATRALWPKEMGEGRHPLCASNDRVKARPFGDFQPFPWETGEPLCADCPHYEDEPWNGDEGCFKGYALLVAIQDFDDEPGIIRVKGTSMAPVKQRLLSHFLPRPGRTLKPVWSMVFALTSEKGEGAKGNYFVLVPKLVDNVDDPDRYRDLARHLAGVSVEAAEEEVPEELPFE